MVHVIFTEQTQYYYWFLFSNEQDFLAKNKSNGTPIQSVEPLKMLLLNQYHTRHGLCLNTISGFFVIKFEKLDPVLLQEEENLQHF